MTTWTPEHQQIAKIHDHLTNAFIELANQLQESYSPALIASAINMAGATYAVHSIHLLEGEVSEEKQEELIEVYRTRLEQALENYQIEE
ncbi:MAG: DUF3144 domain-containing protein [SAR324 cluster bacterium]|nr:DUF3144 domain-containing protein [SAR324 cluster bacterium]